MTGTIWIEVRADFDEEPEDWSPFADAFARFGCPGSLISDSPPAISGYLVSVPGSEERALELSDALRNLGAAATRISEVPEEDWSESWRKHFKPRRVGKLFVIRPTWEQFDANENDRVIALDPGQAFGTGDHQTTRMCLELLEGLELQKKAVLDLGCGSGILSIASHMLGASRVVGSDIEALSIEVAKKNAEQNDANVEFVVSDGLDDDRLTGPWNVIVCNIISATLIRLAPEVAARLTPDGHWIVSGIIRQNWEDVRTSAERSGFTLAAERTEDDWVAAIFRR